MCAKIQIKTHQKGNEEKQWGEKLNFFYGKFSSLIFYFGFCPGSSTDFSPFFRISIKFSKFLRFFLRENREFISCVENKRGERLNVTLKRRVPPTLN